MTFRSAGRDCHDSAAPPEQGRALPLRSATGFFSPKVHGSWHRIQMQAAKFLKTRPKTSRWAKHVLDRAGAALWLVILSPLMAAIAAAVWAFLGRPVIFHQTRLGHGEKPFVLLKFRTMAEQAGLSDAERLTPLGRFLRRASLDELPQLMNILRGEMSFVGPRPLLERYRPWYTAAERRRHRMKPGLTGWAQIHGRNHVAWTERLSLDVWYINHWSLRLDAVILLHTVWRVVTGSGVADAPNSAADDLDVERARVGGGF